MHTELNFTYKAISVTLHSGVHSIMAASVRSDTSWSHLAVENDTKESKGTIPDWSMWALFSGRSLTINCTCTSLPLCTIPAEVHKDGGDQDPVILPGGDPNVMPAD